MTLARWTSALVAVLIVVPAATSISLGNATSPVVELGFEPGVGIDTELPGPSDPLGPRVVPGIDAPPNGLGQQDPWVDANGDTMFGTLNMGGFPIQFANGALDGSAFGTGLRFAGAQVCTAGSLVPGCAGAASGDITGVTAGTGLTGGGNTGDVTLSADTTYLQRRVTGTCAAGSAIASILPAGGVTCETDDNTIYTQGTGISIVGATISSTLGTSVDTAEIVDGSILFGDLAANGCIDGQIAKRVAGAWACAADVDTNSGGTVTSVAAGGGLTGGPITLSGTLSIATGGVTNSMLQDNSVTSAKLADNSVSITKIIDTAVTNAKLAVNAVSTDKIAFGAVTSAKISDGTILFADIASNGCTTNQIMEWNGAAWACAALQPVVVVDGNGGTTTIGAACTNYAGSQVTITAPAAGAILVRADVVMNINHVAGTTDLGNLYIGSTTTDCGLVAGDFAQYLFGSALPSDAYYENASFDELFNVGAGTFTYYLNGLQNSGQDASDRFYWGSMTATWFPT